MVRCTCTNRPNCLHLAASDTTHCTPATVRRHPKSTTIRAVNKSSLDGALTNETKSPPPVVAAHTLYARGVDDACSLSICSRTADMAACSLSGEPRKRSRMKSGLRTPSHSLDTLGPCSSARVGRRHDMDSPPSASAGVPSDRAEQQAQDDGNSHEPA